MSHVPLRDAVRAHVEERRLSDDQFAALSGLAAAARPPETSRRWWLWAVAAAAVLAVATGVFVDRRPITDRIADEVTRNHQKLKPLEVQAQSVDGLRAFFAGLDFSLVDSARLVDAGWRLEGARHCSVQGLPAAQLRLRQPGAQATRSVYMAPYEPEVLGPLPRLDVGEAPLTIHARGMAVHIWVERGVAMVAVEPP